MNNIPCYVHWVYYHMVAARESGKLLEVQQRGIYMAGALVSSMGRNGGAVL